MKNWLKKTNKTIIPVIFLSVFLILFFFLKNNEQKSKDIKKDRYIENKNIEIPFAMPPIDVPIFPENICNIKNYGAIGDGIFINTRSIKNAIKDCFQKGGGKIIFPEGKWLTGPIHLRNNINLYLEKNSEIIFTSNLDDYLPVVFTKFQGMEYYNFSPPIYAKDCKNIALTGDGKISGNGDFWEKWAGSDNSEIQREKLFEMSQANIPTEKRIWGTKDSGLRPSFIQFINCKNIFIEGLTIENGPMWTVHPVYSENIIIRKINIRTHSMNTDGIVIESSKNVLIENSDFSTGDDAIAIKSGLENEGIRINRPSENIVIKNCNFTLGHGSITIGSEMSGGIRNVFVGNSTFDGTNSGLRIKSAKSRGGFIENIWIDNIKMKNIREDAISVNFKYKTALKTSRISREPILKNIYVKNIDGESINKAISIIGLSEGKMENIFFENLKFQTENQSDITHAKNINFKNIFLKTNSPGPVLKIENSQNIKFNNFKCENKGNSRLDVIKSKISRMSLEKMGD
jgi:polygalacturonase